MYEFKCQECGIVIESVYNDRELFCDDGHEPAVMRRVYSFGGFVLKGNGWASKN